MPSDADRYLIRGAPTKDAARPPVRMEVRDMQQNHPQMWELYLLGLLEFQNVEQQKTIDEPFSWFQIAGIHGLPYAKWPLEEEWNTNIPAVATNRGFCTHSSILFLPWHRPYLALFETELYKHVQVVAKQFSDDKDADLYAQAAENFRIPYWDWADQKLNVFPEAALQSTGPDKLVPGKKLERNPLAWHNFTSDVGSNIRIPKFDRTVRYPFNLENERDRKQQDALNTFFNNPDWRRGRNLTERTTFILQSYKTYGPMSQNSLMDPKERLSNFENYGSLEDVHNMLHDVTGGNGHMSDPKFAAFDPIFWLHHTNIDRLFAIWQALHDDTEDEKTWITPTMSRDVRGGTFSHGNSVEDQDTDLEPFFKDGKTSFWKGRDCRSTKTFGYVYPETQDWVVKTRKELVQLLDDKYPAGSAATLLKKSRGNIDDDTITDIEARAKVHIQVAENQLDSTTFQQIAEPVSIEQVVLPKQRAVEDIAPNGKYLEWLVDIRAQKHSLSGQYAVHIFLGIPDDEHPVLYPASPMHISFFAPFGQDEDTGCEKCKQDQEDGLVITGQIPLTIALLERYLSGQIESLTPTHVVPWLQENLHWRVVNKTGVLTERDNVDGLVVAVVSNEVTLPQSPSDLPIYADEVVPWPDITTKSDGTTPRGDGTGFTASG